MIDPISSNAAAYTQALNGADQQSGSSSQPVMSNVANLLGMSTSDLVTALQGGTSMSALASQKGVSQDDLLSAINQGLQSEGTAAASGQTTDTSSLASQIADRKGLGGHHHHHHGDASGGSAGSSTDLQQNVSDLASSLGISNDQLVQALQAGLAGTSGTTGSGTTGYGVPSSLLQGLQVNELA